MEEKAKWTNNYGVRKCFLEFCFQMAGNVIPLGPYNSVPAFHINTSSSISSLSYHI